jgi:3'-5' exoribonuclease
MSARTEFNSQRHYQNFMTSLEKAGQAKNLLIGIAEKLTVPALTDACKVVLYDPTFVTQYGSSGKHHSYPGGLAMHTLEVTQFALKMAEMLPMADTDVVATAAIFHDYTKIKEYAPAAQFGDGGSVRHTNYRKFIRHVAGSHAAFMIAIEGKRVPEEKVFRIEHAILAHHGSIAAGSPIDMALIEAYIVHYADSFSAKFGPSKG